MKSKRPADTAPLNHLTALHLLGRILERQDGEEHSPRCRNRYQRAMQHLSQALDRVEQALVVREVLEANPAPAARTPWLVK